MLQDPLAESRIIPGVARCTAATYKSFETVVEGPCLNPIAATDVMCCLVARDIDDDT